MVVHNGIIENYQELREKLLRHGYQFYSDTDTEVVIKLVDYYYKKYKIGPVDAIAKTMVRVRGSYALELMFRDYPGEIWVAEPRVSATALGCSWISFIIKCSKPPLSAASAENVTWYRKPRFRADTLVLVISQSGETADTLAALRLAKENDVPTISFSFRLPSRQTA